MSASGLEGDILDELQTVVPVATAAEHRGWRQD